MEDKQVIEKKINDIEHKISLFKNCKSEPIRELVDLLEKKVADMYGFLAILEGFPPKYVKFYFKY